MKRLAELVKQDLTYIGGERESGPNGAKKEYLQTGKTFLRAMAKDLGFAESKVYDMPGGIGVAGEIAMMGIWSEGNGVYVLIHEDNFTGCIMYRTIRHLGDHTGGYNRHLPHGWLLRRYVIDAHKLCPLEKMEAVVRSSGLSYYRCEWAPDLNGIDDYYLDSLRRQGKQVA